jgi:hypothetical protein
MACFAIPVVSEVLDEDWAHIVNADFRLESQPQSGTLNTFIQSGLN